MNVLAEQDTLVMSRLHWQRITSIVSHVRKGSTRVLLRPNVRAAMLGNTHLVRVLQGAKNVAQAAMLLTIKREKEIAEGISKRQSRKMNKMSSVRANAL